MAEIKYTSAGLEVNGTITATTLSASTNATLESPAFTGIPTAPTAAAATSNTQIATTAYVKSQNYLDQSYSKSWTANITCARWSRILALTGAAVTGHSLILTINGTRNSVVYNVTFSISTSHSGKGVISQLSNTEYSNIKIRTVVDANGNGYIEVWDDNAGATTATTQLCYCRYVNLSGTTFTEYTANTDGTTIPGGYAANGEITTTLRTVTGDLASLSTTQKSNLVGAINELFQNVSDGKTSIATAITGKGVAASGSDTFATLSTKIGQINTGKRYATGTTTATNIVQTLGWQPTMIMVRSDAGGVAVWFRPTWGYATRSITGYSPTTYGPWTVQAVANCLYMYAGSASTNYTNATSAFNATGFNVTFPNSNGGTFTWQAWE